MGNVLCIAAAGLDPRRRRHKHVIAKETHNKARNAKPCRTFPFPPVTHAISSLAPLVGNVNKMSLAEDVKNTCIAYVLAVFPDICPDHLSRTAEERGFDQEQVVTHILDQCETGASYPKRPRPTTLKRKRVDDEEEDGLVEATRKFDNADRRQRPKNIEYVKLSKQLLQQGFPTVTVKNLYPLFEANDQCLFPTFVALDKIMEEWDDRNPTFKVKKQGPRTLVQYSAEWLDQTIANTANDAMKEALEEFRAAKQLRKARSDKKDAEKQQELEELENLRRAHDEGTVQDCECCYMEHPLNRMVHCDGNTLHWFCRDCARRMAETEIGLSKYHLACMSMEGCTAGFSRQQKDVFLDAKTKIALERIEQEAVLRLAGIDDLETCPFCPFAAEYPPVEENKEFRCQNPECQEVSCRLCRKQTHIPKTCAEAEKENGHSARREIEEAMSAAMIRKCNKCSTPFIKENGCNKMTCTRNGCFNIQCYVCHKSCDYSHFNDASRGGKTGNCPLFESAEQRHEDEVRVAEEAARQQVANQNPELNAELLVIEVSEQVKADEQRRKDSDIQRNGLIPPAPHRPAALLGNIFRFGQRPGDPPAVPQPPAVAAVPVPPQAPAYPPGFGIGFGFLNNVFGQAAAPVPQLPAQLNYPAPAPQIPDHGQRLDDVQWLNEVQARVDALRPDLKQQAARKLRGPRVQPIEEEVLRKDIERIRQGHLKAQRDLMRAQQEQLRRRKGRLNGQDARLENNRAGGVRQKPQPKVNRLGLNGYEATQAAAPVQNIHQFAQPLLNQRAVDQNAAVPFQQYAFAPWLQQEQGAPGFGMPNVMGNMAQDPIQGLDVPVAPFDFNWPGVVQQPGQGPF